jgi:hypothetical protein
MDFFIGIQKQKAKKGVNLDDLSFDKGCTTDFRQSLDMKARLPGMVDSGEHPGPHARIIVVRGRIDQGHPVTAFNEA